MTDNERDFGLFIDGLRLSRNISREELINDIISLSQYKRYLRGASSIPNSVLIQIADRLKLRISDIHFMYKQKSDKQYKRIHRIYTEIRDNNYEKAYQLAKDMKTQATFSDYNKLFFDFCMITIQYNLKLVSAVHVLGMYSKLINYPDCTNNDSFNWVETITLLKIVVISARMDNFEPSNLMYETMISDDFISYYSGDIHFLPVVYSTLSQILGSQESYNEVVDLTSRGIEYCRKYEVSTILGHLFILNSLALMDLNKVDEAKESAKNAYMQAYIDNDQVKLKAFDRLIQKRFNMSGEELLSTK